MIEQDNSNTTRRISSVFPSRPEHDISTAMGDATKQSILNDPNKFLSKSYLEILKSTKKFPVLSDFPPNQLTKHERGKFINGATVALKHQNFVIKRIIEVIKQLTDKNVSEFRIRKVWAYWTRTGTVHHSAAQQICFDISREALAPCPVQCFPTLPLPFDVINRSIQEKKAQQESMVMNQSVILNSSNIYQPNITQSILPALPTQIPQPGNNLLVASKMIPEELQTKANNQNILGQASSVPQPVEIEKKDTKYSIIKRAILQSKRNDNPEWIKVGVRIMISVSQFTRKQHIELQCLVKLKEVIRYKCIRWRSVVMGETINSKGKYLYFSCKFDKTVIKKRKYFKEFLLEYIPQYFYSHNCTSAQKLEVVEFETFKLVQEKQDFFKNYYNKTYNCSSKKY